MFAWKEFGIGLVVAAVVSGFIMTIGGQDTAVTAVTAPLLIGGGVWLDAWRRGRKTTPRGPS